MSWTNDLPNNVFDYLYVAEIMDRGIPLGGISTTDEEHGRCATILEQALDFALVNACSTLGLTKFKSPYDCPEPFLHNLAVERGVSGWYDGDSEQIRRDVIAKSSELHRGAGTIKGVTNALQTLGINVAVAPSKLPYRLTFMTNQPLTPEETQQISERVGHYKSERDDVYISSDNPSRAQSYYAAVSVRFGSYHSVSTGGA